MKHEVERNEYKADGYEVIEYPLRGGSTFAVLVPYSDGPRWYDEGAVSNVYYARNFVYYARNFGVAS